MFNKKKYADGKGFGRDEIKDDLMSKGLPAEVVEAALDDVDFHIP